MELTLKLPPLSFPSLLLAGFVLVAMPLLGGILGMHHALNKMAQEGRRSVNITAEITLFSRQLTEASNALKRAAGQYFVLEDPTLSRRLIRSHQQFRSILADLRSMPWEPGEEALLEELATLERGLFTRLEEAPDTGVEVFATFSADFDRLTAATSTVVHQASGVVRRQLAGMSQAAERAHRRLLRQLGSLILLSLMLSAFLSWMLSRPVFQLAAAIHRLGRNDLETPTPIGGPGDMVYLGEQLDWLRRRLLELEEKKLCFFREVSHELKTPLTNLLEAVALLHDEVTGPLSDQQREIVAIMGGSSRELKRRIEDLLRYNEALSQPRIVPVRFDLRALVSEVGARLDLLRRTKRLQWVESVPGIRVCTDRGRLAVALENLIGNAIKFSPREGCVKVTAEVEDRWLRIRVCDQGPGVDTGDGLFQPFYKGAEQPSGGVKSSGLGLAIAKAHMESLGGELALVPAPGQGACFQLLLPLANEEENNHG